MTNQNTAALLGEDGDIEKLRELSDAAPAGPWTVAGDDIVAHPSGEWPNIAFAPGVAAFVAGAVNYVRAALARTNNTGPVRALIEKWRRQAVEHGTRTFTGNDHALFANELEAAIASAPPGAPSDDLSPLLDSLMRAAFDDGDRGREKFSGATMAAREAVLAHVRGASAPPSATVGVEAYLVERLGGEGYGNTRSIIDAAFYDPTKPAFWSSPEAQARHRVTPLVPALAQQPAAAQPDWEVAPPGATHYQPHQSAYYKRVSASEWYVWSRVEDRELLRWLPSPGTSDSAELVVRPANALAQQPAAPSGEPVAYSEKFRASGDWSRYPIGTRAYDIQGGYWERVANGWKWCTGSTFPTPGGDAFYVAVPARVPAPPSAPVGVEGLVAKLRAVLCDPAGNVCIEGSDADRAEVQGALDALEALAKQPAAPSGGAVGLPNDLRWKLDNLRPGSSGVVTLNREEWDCVRAMFTAPQQPAAVNGYIANVPDNCDRIVWRGSYYHLPPKQPAAVDWDEVRRVAQHIGSAVAYIDKVYPNAKMLDRRSLLRNMRRWHERLTTALAAQQQGGV